MRVTIPLREGVAFSDGEPFTAADVVYTVETLKAVEGFDAHTFFVDNVEIMTAVYDYTVEFVLKPVKRRSFRDYEPHE